jgi:hypothetical protein
MRSRTSPRPAGMDELGRCGAEHGVGVGRVGAALASHGRGHRFETCHAHQHKQVLTPPSRARLPADCPANHVQCVWKRLECCPIRGSRHTPLVALRGPTVPDAARVDDMPLVAEAEGFEPATSVPQRPWSWPRRRSGLRFLHARGDRSCPARTGGPRCYADPARTCTAATYDASLGCERRDAGR